MSKIKNIQSKILPFLKKLNTKGKTWLKGETDNKYVVYLIGGVFIFFVGSSLFGGSKLSREEQKSINASCSELIPGIEPESDRPKKKKYCKCMVSKAKNIVTFDEYSKLGRTGALAIQDPKQMSRKLKKLNKIMDVCFAKYY